MNKTQVLLEILEIIDYLYSNMVSSKAQLLWECASNDKPEKDMRAEEKINKMAHKNKIANMFLDMDVE